MLTILILVAAFVAVACLVVGVASMFVLTPAQSMVEDRLAILTGQVNPNSGKKDTSVLSSPLDEGSHLLEDFFARFINLRTFLQQYKFPVTWTRAANVYGPGQQLYRIIPRTILSIKLGHKLQLHGGGHSVRSFIHIDDVADATLKVARSAPAGECYHLSTARFVSIRELVEMICQMMNADFSAVAQITDDRPGKDAAYTLDSTKARSTLGWRDTVALEDGVRATIAWVETHLDEIRWQPPDYIHKP